jgi:TonB-linked SusC/RagA family outer membrane protein
MKKQLVVFLTLLMLGGTMMAQRVISGKVTDKDGPLAFVTVLAKGTTAGASTNEEGEFRLEVPSDADVLVFSLVGYKTIEQTIGTSNTMDLVMVEDAFELEEVVVTGFSSIRRKDITGSVSSVDGSAIADQPVVGVQNALQGRAAGVQVVTNNGAPGAGIDVRVRGSTSISASNQPLFVVDGVPVVSGDFSQNGVGNAGLNALADINPNDIESIEVLKDASTAAIYGSRGANGVVLITTKKGKAGKTQINLNSSYGFQQAWNTVDMLDADQYYDVILEEAAQNAFGVGIADLGILKGTGNTNWQDEVFRTGAVSDNTLSISGGNSKTRFFSSMSYFMNEGIVKGTQQDRYSGRLNVDHRASRKFKMGMNLSFTNNNIKRVQNDNNIYGAVSTAILMPPDVPLFNDDGTYATAYGLENPLAAVTEYQNNAVSNRVIGNVFGEYEIVPDLTFKAVVGIDLNALREEVYEPNVLQSARGTNGRGFVGQQTFMRWLTDYTLNYSKQFDKHSIRALAGIGFQKDVRQGSFVDGTGFPTQDFTTLNTAANITAGSADWTSNALQSYFGNVQYTYADKYILNAVFRADGFSAFGVNSRFGYFPSFSAAWRISEEGFMDNVGLFDDLKLRASYGVTGNNNIGNFAAQQLYAGGFNYELLPGIAPSQLGNPDLKWETTGQLNLGLDFTILNNRISGNIDYFDKRTTDLLLNRPIPTTSGFTTVVSNIGEIRNWGVEFNIQTRNMVGEFKWTTDFNIARIRNEVIALFEDQPLDFGFGTRIAVGQPIGAFFGYQVDRLFQESDFTNGVLNEGIATQPNAAPGDIKFVDNNGDGVINDDDRDFIGSAQPDFVGGMTNTLSYKGLEFSFFFQWSVGNEIFNNNAAFAEGMNSVFNQSARTLDRWTPDNTDTDMPRAVWGDPNGNRRDSDRFVEDGSYLRLRTATLSYTFPKSVSNALSLSGIRVYVAGQNLLTFTNYSWFDPEVNTFDGSNVALGTDFLTYPQARSITGGINITF